MATLKFTATVLRAKIDNANSEAELRPLVSSYLELLLDADISRPHRGLYLLPGGILSDGDASM
ncbi:unnamed protein product, partial [marine sediment metagenome]